ncbi:hypothetical protein RQP46_003316 [Phenoliferia psychrophenolica]
MAPPSSSSVAKTKTKAPPAATVASKKKDAPAAAAKSTAADAKKKKATEAKATPDEATKKAKADQPKLMFGAGGKLTIGEAIVEPGKINPKKKGKTVKDGVDERLPPIIALDDIFEDLLKKVDLSNAIKTLDGRKLRVGTMCSGTESPLLALDIVSNILRRQDGYKLEVEHIFSAEIEPYKQAYIERNFSPPFLFRDVTELGNDYAHTAYGGLVPVPGDIDVLVAGTSCVDYSALNVNGKGIDDGGESGETFGGMLRYVNKHRPPIVILENVCKAPWKTVVTRFSEIGYDALDTRLDTKSYYIPHTRTRGYLIATLKVKGSKGLKSTNHAREWKNTMKYLERPASVSLEAFLLPTDDPRVSRARLSKSTVKLTKGGSKRAPPPWALCETRHARSRKEEELGQQRVLTKWVDGGGQPNPVEGLWRSWLGVQVERICDLMDINSLRLAMEMVDAQSKSIIWDLSQNVDRGAGSKSYGITPCLTPHMVPFLGVRGGPLIAEEALSLQGIPIDVLLLTRETEDQLANLAGNAMSSTVVGAALLSALQVAGLQLKKRVPKDGDTPMADGTSLASTDSTAQIVGADLLTAHDVDLSTFSALTPALLALALQTARKCECEGRRGTSSAAIYKCTSCTRSTCADCKTRPEHHDVVDPAPRAHPDVFEAEVKKVLPLRFTLDGFGKEALEEVFANAVKTGAPVAAKLKEKYIERLAEAIPNREFHFRGLTRRTVWTATYANESASVDLTFNATGLTWALTVLAPSNLSAAHHLRVFLQEPVARLSLGPDATSFDEGSWEVRVPLETTPEKPSKDQSGEFNVKIAHVGAEVPSWRQSLDLIAFAEETRAARLQVTVSAKASKILSRPIDGEYVLEDKCAAPTNSLYRRVDNAAGDKPLFLFLDPTRSGQSELDSYAFADSCDKLDYGSFRSPIARLPNSWWPATRLNNALETLNLRVTSTWLPLSSTKIARGPSVPATIAMRSAALPLSADEHVATCLLSAKIHLSASTGLLLTKDSEWSTLDLVRQGPDFFRQLAWVFARLPLWDSLQDWQALSIKSLSACSTCCPPSPPIHWVRKKTAPKAKKVKEGEEEKEKAPPSYVRVAIEDGREAAAFEQAMKARPVPILVQSRGLEDSLEVRIGLNVPSLAHKALAALPINNDASPTLEWRLTPVDGTALDLGRAAVATVFNLSSNKQDLPSAQPPHFKKALLRPEQLRSLTWMVAQESAPTPWFEQEIAEAVLPQPGWHAEVKATRSVLVRGGVLADEVGYGKTAITLALISAQLAATDVSDDPERIGLKATLIVVPGHLIEQWEAEITKFTGDKLEVLVISKFTILKTHTIADFQAADIVLISDSVLSSETFWKDYAHFCGVPSLRFEKSQKAGRFFKAQVGEMNEQLDEQVRRLRDPARGPSDVFDFIKLRRSAKVDTDKLDLEKVNLTKRKTGALYTLSKAQALASELEDKKKSETDGKKPEEDEDTPEADVPVGEDRWSLDSCKSWKGMKNPPLAIFAFNRLVIDEFTNQFATHLVATQSIKASFRWILSGTPPLRDVTELKTFAGFLSILQESTSEQSLKEATAAEKFHSYRDVKTAKWHTTREKVAQKFLDQFVRQNVAEIDEIKYIERIVPVVLPGVEKALKISRVSKKLRGDREVRLAEALGTSATPLEALLKRASHFKEGAADDTSNPCESILNLRDVQREDCLKEFVTLIRTTSAMHLWLVKEKYYAPQVGAKKADEHSYLQVHRDSTTIGDSEASRQIREACETAGCANGEIPEWTEDMQEVISEDKTLSDFRHLASGKPAADVEENRKARVWNVRERVDRLRALTKELLGRNRSLRYFLHIRNAQLGLVPDVDSLAMLTSCGHHGPIEVVRRAALTGKCFEAPVCSAVAQATGFVLASSLCDGAGSGTFGAKLETLVDLISAIPDTDRVLVFVQFEDLLSKVEEALVAFGIPVQTLSSGTASGIITAFQKSEGTNHKVLLLLAADKSASGTNLTIANHAIFFSPLLAPTKAAYTAFETQAIGRIRRYGQLKTANVYRLVSRDTIDEKLLNDNGVSSYAQTKFKDSGGSGVVSVEDTLKIQLADTSLVTNFPRTTLKLDLTAAPKKAVKVAKAKAKAKVEEPEESDEEEAEDSEDEMWTSRFADEEGSGEDEDEDEEVEAEEVVKPTAKKAAPKKADVKPAAKATKAKPAAKTKRVADSDDAEASPAPKKKKGKAPVVVVSDSDDAAPSTSKPKAKPATKKAAAVPKAKAATATKPKAAATSSSSAAPSSSTAPAPANKGLGAFFTKTPAPKRAVEDAVAEGAAPAKRAKTSEEEVKEGAETPASGSEIGSAKGGSTSATSVATEGEKTS